MEMVMAGETEKITINLGVIDLGQIDLLVQEGFYSNRTDFIRTAIRNHLATHADVVRQTVSRKTLVLGLQEFTRADLEAVKKSGKRLRIQVLGLARIASDVSAALALATQGAPVGDSPAPASTPKERTQFSEHTYTGPAGTRRYKLFIPSAYRGQPLPLAVMLHGCTQTPDDFATGTRMNMLAEERSCFVLYPEQPQSANMAKCW